MPTVTQTIGHGSSIEYGDGATPEVFAAVAGVVSIDLGSSKVDVHDNTDMGTTGIARTFIGGLSNVGDVTVKLNVKPGDTSQADFLAKKDSQVHNFKVIYPGATRTIAFAAVMLSDDESIPDDKLPTYTVKLQISGDKTIS